MQNFSYYSFENTVKQVLFQNDDDVDVKIEQLLKMDITTFERWYHYINMDCKEGIIYHTFHGTKGLEFDNVIMIFGDSFGMRKKTFFTNYFDARILLFQRLSITLFYELFQIRLRQPVLRICSQTPADLFRSVTRPGNRLADRKKAHNDHDYIRSSRYDRLMACRKFDRFSFGTIRLHQHNIRALRHACQYIR